MENKIVPLIDHKKEIRFWVEALSNKNISRNNKILMNKCLNNELNNYLSPMKLSKESLKKVNFNSVWFK